LGGEAKTWQLMNDRFRLAKYLFSLDAVLGILSIGGAVLYGAAYSSSSVWVAFFPVFVPFAALWALFCYGAYKGLTSPNVFSKIVFWLFVVGHVVAFPVGTAISGACIWLWRGLSSHSKGGQGSVVAQQAGPADPGYD
jgi:hypothetical protein